MSDDSKGLMASAGARALQTRWLVRMPIWLYRAGMGFLFGNRLLMLEHIGRKTGARRYVVLEVVEHPTHDEYVIVAGFGDRAQWYRNIVANHSVRVSVGLRRRVTATAVPMSEEEAKAALRHYATVHPKAWANLRATIEAAVGHTVDGLPMVTLQMATAG